MGLQERFALFEPYARELIAGFDAIGAAAGYGPDYFRTRYLDVPASKQAVAPGILSYHTGLGHYYLYRGEPATLPNSAAAWGANIQMTIEQEQRDRVPGWYGSRACPVSAGSVVQSLVAGSTETAGLDFELGSRSVAI